MKRGFLQAYLITTLIFGILGFIDNIFAAANFTFALYNKIVTILLFLFFFFNIFAIAFFIYQKIERLAYILPIYHLVSSLLFLGIGFWIANKQFSPDFWIALIVLGTILSLFEIIFSVYLLRKFKLLFFR